MRPTATATTPLWRNPFGGIPSPVAHGVIAVIALPSPVPRQHPLGLLRPPARCLSHAAHSGALAATRRGCDRRSGPGPVHHRRTPLVAVKPWRCAPASQRHKLLRLQNMRPGQWDSIQPVVISQDDYEIISESHSRPRMHAARCRSDRLTVQLMKALVRDAPPAAMGLVESAHGLG